MLQVVLEEEAKRKEVCKDVSDDAGYGKKMSDDTTGSLSAPTTWPSYTVQKEEIIQVDSQADSQGSRNTTKAENEAADAFASHITVEENARELAFAIAAGDVPANASGLGGHRDHLDENANNGPQQLPDGEETEGPPAAEGLLSSQEMATGVLPVSSPALESNVGPKQTDLKHRLV